MFKKLLFGIAAITALFHSYNSEGQSRKTSNSSSTDWQKGLHQCGTDYAFISTLGIDTSSSSSPTSSVVPISFSAAAKDTCGKFIIYYEDMNIASGSGFDSGSGVGANRRAVVCQVLTYIQSRIDFSAMTSGNYIRLYVDTSFSKGYNPAPTGTGFYARAGAFFPTASGVSSGFVHQYIKSGSDPVPLYFHAVMQLNFDKTFSGITAYPIDYYEGLGTSISNCQIDLATSILHEITHTLGWYSILDAYAMSGSYSITGTGKFTSIDTSVRYATNELNPLGTLNKLVTGSTISSTSGLYFNQFWINGKKAPLNHPSAIGFSHLQDYRGALFNQRMSTGDWQPYVMGPYGMVGTQRREYTKGELETLHDVLQYGYDATYLSSSSAIISNTPPYSSKMASATYAAIFKGAGSYTINIAEELPVDTVIVNDSLSELTIYLNRDTSLKDADGDSLYVQPGSLVNFRGCGLGGNNHDLLTVGSGGKSITFKPRHNFYGVAQFGYNLSDSKEKGGFVVHTILVQKGTNVNAKPGEELVLNGEMEEGSEVKIKGSSETINNTANDMNGMYEGRMQNGAYYADSHPYDWYTNGIIDNGGGTIIKDSKALCSEASLLKYGFGAAGNTFPTVMGLIPTLPYSWWLGSGVVPPAKGGAGNRYQLMRENTIGLYYLAENLQNCHKYILEFDVFRPWYPTVYMVPKMTFDIGFTDTSRTSLKNLDWSEYYSDWHTYGQLTPYPEIELDTVWEHVKLEFSYCNDTPANILTIANKTNWSFDGYFLDNISLKEDTTPVLLTLLDTLQVPCANTKLLARVLNGSKYGCSGIKYYWTANGDTVSRDSFIYVSPKVITKYVATITSGCITLKDSITLNPTPAPIVAVSDTSMCIGSSVTLHPTVSGTTGTVSYSWSPTTGLSCSSCASPTASPTTTTLYTLTVSDSLECTKVPVLVTVHELPMISASDIEICEGTTDYIKVSGGIGDTYLWDDTGLPCYTCDSTLTYPLTVTTDFPVTVTDKYGCSSRDTATVTVKPAPSISVTPRPARVCFGDTLLLKASGGLSPYTWLGVPAFKSCTTCDSVYVYPLSSTSFRVFAMGVNGCIGKDSFLVEVIPAPPVNAHPSDTGICGIGYITLSATGALSYSWSPAFGLTSPTSASTAAYVPATTKYIVTGTDPMGCVGKDSVTVTVNTPPTVSTTTPLINTCSTDSLTLTATGASTYSWSPTTGFTCPTCNPAKVAAPSTPTTYIVTGTDANGCTDTGKVVVNTNVCPCTPATVFGTTATTLTTGTLPTTVSSGYYHILSNLNINSNTVMTGAKILIERGVTITVANNVKLTLDNCHLFTCDEDTSKAMWNGIVLASTGSAPGGTSGRIEVKNNTLIEDAQTAITAIYPKIPSSGDIISSIHSIYNRNQLDIYVQGLNVSTPSTYPFTIKSNVFTARKFSKTTMTGYPNTWASANSLKTKITPIDAKVSYSLNRNYPRAMAKDSVMKYMGISIQYVGLTTGAGVSFAEMVIGGSNSDDSANVFDNHKYGIYSNRSNVTVYNGTFINLSKRYNPSTVSAAVLPDWGGLGIFARSDSARYDRMRILSSSGNVTNRFHDCFDAMAMDNMAEFTVSFAEVTTSHQAGSTAPGAAYPSEIYSGTGMWITGHKNHSKWSVNNNTFSNVNKGITAYLQNPKAGATTNFDNNKFYNANPATAYASFKGKQYTYLAIEASIGAVGFDNTFTASGNYMDKVFNGIMISNLATSKPTVNANQIILWDTSISGVTSTGQFAIQMNSCKSGTISSNIISTPTLNPVVALGDRIKGVFVNFNGDLKVCSNTTTNIGRGFEFGGKTSQIGTRWIDNTMTNSYKGFVLGSDIGDQGFMYNWLTISPRTFYGAILNKWNGSWSVASNKYQTVGIDKINTMLSKLYINTTGAAAAFELPTINTAIPSGVPPYKYMPTGIFTSELPPTSQWNANCAGALYPTKTTSVPIGGVGKSFAVLLMADSLGYDSTYRPNQWMGQLSLYQMGVFDPELRDSIHELNDFMIAAENSRYKWISDIEMAFANDSLTQVQDLLDNPNRGNGYEFVDTNIAISDYSEADYVVENYTNYYTIYLHYLQGSMTGEDSTLLYELAQKCPAKDGAVVYQARGLQGQVNKEMVVYNDDDCLYGNGAQYRISKDAEITGEQRYNLFPNPNNGSFVIKQNIEEDKVVNLKVYNAIGILVYQAEARFINGQMNVVLKQKAQGVYLVCIGNDTERTTCLRFIIN